MHVHPILKKTMSLVTPDMHSRRRCALTDAIDSLLNGASATVTALGRGIASPAKEKHRIKRADRLLSNRHLHAQTLTLYQQLAKFTVGKAKRPILLVDWSDLDEHKGHFLLRATLVSHRRGLCLYEEVHDLSTKEKPKTHRQFLSRLAEVLGQQCQPIIVTDAGFKTPCFRAVLAMGWDFVGRARLPNFYSVDNEHWQCITQLYKQATQRPKLLKGAIARRNPLPCNLVIVKQKSTGRKVLNHAGCERQSKQHRVHRKSANDPWLLATSLSHSAFLATKITKIYRYRMQIEEGFRDMKSHRFGQGFEYNKTTHKERLSVLILLTTITHWILMVIGLAARQTQHHRQYQANSLKTDSVLSLPFIGFRVIADKYAKLKIREFMKSVRALHLSSAYLFETL